MGPRNSLSANNIASQAVHTAVSEQAQALAQECLALASLNIIASQLEMESGGGESR